jgi:hypothetical protein
MIIFHISDTTKGRFIQLYRFSDKTLDDEVFTNTVLELIKLIQASLALFRSYSLLAEERNGLLCDVTVKGMHDWVTVVGEPLLGIEVGFRFCRFEQPINDISPQTR